MRWRVSFRGVFRALLGVCALLLATATWSQTLTIIQPPQSSTNGLVLNISPDGSAAAGYYYDQLTETDRAFRWTVTDGVRDLGTFGSYTYGTGISADGTVVVGTSTNIVQRAFRWTVDSGIQSIGSLGGAISSAESVSADGTVIVGVSEDFGQRRRAFRWTLTGGMQSIDTVGGFMSHATDVSADGSVVVGNYIATGWHRAFRWTASSGMQDIGVPDPRYRGASARAVSADGLVIVGVSSGMDDDDAFRWTEGEGFRILEKFPDGSLFFPYDVSSDGSVIVGTFYRNSLSHAARWTQSGGLEELSNTYASLLPPNAFFAYATSISPDGRYIAGGIYYLDGKLVPYLLDTQPSCATHNGDVDNNGCVDDADLLQVLFAFGSTGSTLGRADVNCDQVVDDADLLIVLFNFGTGC